jgi:hypothetical protein
MTKEEILNILRQTGEAVNSKMPFGMSVPLSRQDVSERFQPYFGGDTQSNLNTALLLYGGAKPKPVAPNREIYRAMQKISGGDRNVMGRLAQLVEQGKGRQPLGQTGVDAQRIAEGLDLESTMTNQTMVKRFNEILALMDRLGIKPVQEGFNLKKLL